MKNLLLKLISKIIEDGAVGPEIGPKEEVIAGKIKKFLPIMMREEMENHNKNKKEAR